MKCFEGPAAKNAFILKYVVINSPSIKKNNVFYIFFKMNFSQFMLNVYGNNIHVYSILLYFYNELRCYLPNIP
jgi:hypothetical protein